MKIIAIYGVGDSGKTTAIKRFFNKYVNEDYGFEDVVDQSKENCKDILITAKYGDIKVGVSSQGDSDYFVNKALDAFAECDIVICACRTKGGSEQALEAKAKMDDGHLCWLGKARISLWKGNKSVKGAEKLQERAVDDMSEMIYHAFQMLTMKE